MDRSRAEVAHIMSDERICRERVGAASKEADHQIPPQQPSTQRGVEWRIACCEGHVWPQSCALPRDALEGKGPQRRHQKP